MTGSIICREVAYDIIKEIQEDMATNGGHVDRRLIAIMRETLRVDHAIHAGTIGMGGLRIQESVESHGGYAATSRVQ